MAWESDRKQQQWHRRNVFLTSAGTRRARAAESAFRLLRVPALEPCLCTFPVSAKTLIFPRSSGGGGPRGLGPEGWRSSDSWRSSQFGSDSMRSKCFERQEAIERQRQRCNGLRKCALQAIRECLQAMQARKQSNRLRKQLQATQSLAEALWKPLTLDSISSASNCNSISYASLLRLPATQLRLEAKASKASRIACSRFQTAPRSD